MLNDNSFPPIWNIDDNHHDDFDRDPSEAQKQVFEYIAKTLTDPNSNPLNLQLALEDANRITIELDPKNFLSRAGLLSWQLCHNKKEVMLKILEEIYKHALILETTYGSDKLTTVISICITALDDYSVSGSPDMVCNFCTPSHFFLSRNSTQSKDQFKMVMDLIKPIKDIVKCHLDKHIKELKRQQKQQQNLFRTQAHSNLIIKTVN